MSSGVTLEGNVVERDGRHAGGRGGGSNDMLVGENDGGARPLHCGGVGLQLDGAVSLTCLRNS